MGLLRIMLPPKLQLLAVLAFGLAVLFIENQIQKLDESRGKLGELRRAAPRRAGPGRASVWGAVGMAGGTKVELAGEGGDDSARSWEGKAAPHPLPSAELAGTGRTARWLLLRGPCVYVSANPV